MSVRTAAKTIRIAMVSIGVIGVLFVISALAYQLAEPIYVSGEWQYDVLLGDLEGISELHLDGEILYATQELTGSRGRLLRIGDDGVEVLLDGLNKPAGITVDNDTFFLTIEGRNPGLLAYKDGSAEYIEGVNSGEGIDSLNDNSIVVIEDNADRGRLLTVDCETYEIEVLLTGLNEGEGLCTFPDGRIFFSEKGLNRVSSYYEGEVTIESEDLYKPGYLTCLGDGSVLITEDSSNRGRLLRLKPNGDITVIASLLRSPQAVTVGRNKELLLAEQGRNRILRFWQE